MSDWEKLQGTAMRVKAGPFSGWVGVAQVWTGKTVQLAFPDAPGDAQGKPERLWFRRDNLEEAK